jgi:hypothetical protein
VDALGCYEIKKIEELALLKFLIKGKENLPFTEKEKL